MIGSFTKSCLSAFLLSLLAMQSGCVALNIPSQRMHDPSDQGGLFGHWKNAKHRQPELVESIPGMDPLVVQEAAEIAQSVAHGSGGFECETGVSSDCDWDGDMLAPSSNEPPAEEIPWPKFHPLPTRPVFGPNGVH
ncbi:MAG: hypothetical protein AAGI63_08890 [Planctomycetota bacterium]